MLVLSRKVGDQIVIDGRIFVTVTAVDGGRIKLGVVAPTDIRIDRAEIACGRPDLPAAPRTGSGRATARSRPAPQRA